MSDESLLRVLRERSVLHAPDGKPFTLKSGALSMTYVDVRLTALNYVGLCLLSRCLARKMGKMDLQPDCVAGVVVGGCPLAMGVSFQTALDVLYVRAEAKDHGTTKLVEGTFEPGITTTVLFEDVITSGGSTLGAIRSLRDAGIKVIGVVAVLDREQGGLGEIRKECPAEALYTLKELLA
jgi:orotate phosphoribosyltransferase